MSGLNLSNLTADGRSTEFSVINARSGGDSTLKTIHVYGDFGTGTATLQTSPDGGTTWIDVLDDGGTAVAFTANGTTNVNIANSAPQDPLKISIDLASSTNPDLNFRYDEAR